MAKQSVQRINNFTAGELSPRLDSRVDLAKYYNGCRTLQNFLLHPQGGAFRRPGLQYIAEVPNSNNITRLIPFKYSDTDAYILEFSDLLIRFYRTVSGVPGIILDDDGTTITTLVSPYSSSELAELQKAQTGDVMYSTHPDYKQRRLVRTDHNSWAISAPEFERGPFLPENDTTTSMKVKIYDIDAVSAGGSGTGTFTISGDGDLSDFIVAGDTIRITGSDDNNGFWTVNSVTYASPPAFVITVAETVTADASHTGKIRPSVEVDEKVQLIASAASGSNSFVGFESTHMGALFELTNPTEGEATDGAFDAVETSEDAGSGRGYIEVFYGQTVLFTTHGSWSGTVVLERSTDSGTNWEEVHTEAFINDDNLKLRHVEDVEDARYRANMTVFGGTGKCKFNLIAQQYKVKGVVEIDTVNSTTTADATVKSRLARSGMPTKKWAEGAWSNKRGWPVAITFFEQRLFFANTAWEPIGIWGSKSLPGGDYHAFGAGVLADDAIVFTMSEAQQDPIKWLSHDRHLIAGTAGAPYSLRGTSANEALTPTNPIHVDRQGNEGSATIAAIQASKGHLFVQQGGRRVYELVYSWEADSLVTADMTRLAEHITEGGVTEMALQKRPEPILWCVTGDGNAIAFTYLREEGVAGWCNIVTDGDIESVAIIPGDEEDEVWFVVKRIINNVTKRYVERLKPWDWGDDHKDAFFVDCGITYSGPAATVITGLGHLEGKTVKVLAGGANHPDRVVVNGVITLKRAATPVHVGLGYEHTLKPMKPSTGTLGSGSPKRIPKMAVSFYKTGYAKYGSNASNMQEVDFARSHMDAAPPLFTDTLTLDYPGGYEDKGDIIFQSDEPMPLTILSITALVESS